MGVQEIWSLPNHCPDCGGEWLNYMADEDYEYYKCLNCDKRIKVPLK